MNSLALPHLLGERSPNASRLRRLIRSELLARRSLAPADHNAIRQVVENLLSEAAVLRDQLRDNPKDEQKRRLCLALITEAVYLASDDEGRHVLWLRRKCIDLTGIAKPTPLLPLALKAYGPYDYDGDARRRRISDQNVSRDYKAIVRKLSPDVLPPGLVNAWNQPGCGVNASSRPRDTVGGKQSSPRPHLISVSTDGDKQKRIMRQSDGTMTMSLIKKTGRRHKLCGMVDDPRIVKLATAYIQRLLAQRKPSPIQT